MGRAPCCEKMGLKKGPWTQDEDQLLIDYIRLHGHSNWRALPKLAGLLRCGKSCRLRWTNYLRPDIKRGNFTPEEEDTIIQLHQLLGNKWSTIAARLPGRTDNEIKNVWHSHLKKKLPKPESDGSSIDGLSMEPTRKRTRKIKSIKDDTSSKKIKSEHMKFIDIQNDDDDNNNDDNNNNCNNSDNNNNNNNKEEATRGPTSPQPCCSGLSTVTCFSNSASENDTRSKQNVGNKEDCFGDFVDEINDDFWMEVLSVQDTAMSTEDIHIHCGDSNISLDHFMIEPMLGSSSGVNGDDVDFFWYDLLTRSNEFPELPEML